MARALLLLVGLGLGLGCRSAPAPAGAPDRLIPLRADQLEGLARAQGVDVVLVNVWATWCAPCVAEMPDLVRIARDFAPRGLGLALLTVDEPSARAEALAVLAARAVPPPYYVRAERAQAFIAGFGEDWTGTLPATALYDRDGTLLAFWEGPVDYATLRGVLEVIEWPND